MITHRDAVRRSVVGVRPAVPAPDRGRRAPQERSTRADQAIIDVASRRDT